MAWEVLSVRPDLHDALLEGGALQELRDDGHGGDVDESTWGGGEGWRSGGRKEWRRRGVASVEEGGVVSVEEERSGKYGGVEEGRSVTSSEGED